MKTAVKKILVHLGVMALLGILLLIGVTNWLDKYTHHGSAIHVPPLTDLTMEQAIPLLEELGLRYEIVDSMHISGKPAGVILEQKPSANAKVKIGRIVFITLNKAIEESMAVPYVIDFSQRQAIASLEGAGFVVNEICLCPLSQKSGYRSSLPWRKHRGRHYSAGGFILESYRRPGQVERLCAGTRIDGSTLGFGYSNGTSVRSEHRRSHLRCNTSKRATGQKLFCLSPRTARKRLSPGR